jgi:hypothetical protein
MPVATTVCFESGVVRASSTSHIRTRCPLLSTTPDLTRNIVEPSTIDVYSSKIMKPLLCRCIRLAILVTVSVALLSLAQDRLLHSSYLRHRSLQLSRATYQQRPSIQYQQQNVNIEAAGSSTRGSFPTQIHEVESKRSIQNHEQMISTPGQQFGGSQQDYYLNGIQDSNMPRQAHFIPINDSQERDAGPQQRMNQSQQQNSWTINDSLQKDGSLRPDEYPTNTRGGYLERNGFKDRDHPLQQVTQSHGQVGATMHIPQTQALPQTLQSQLQSRQPIYSQFQTPETQQSNQLQVMSSQSVSGPGFIPPEKQVLQALNQHVTDSRLGVSVPEQDPECVVPDAAEKPVRHPVWTASYPGSGAKLTWKLIRAITGIFTSDDHDHNGRVEKGTIVAVKTHYPSHTPPEVFRSDKVKHISRAVLLTRNPINSIPSYHNFVYEQQNGLLNHSTRAPIEVWIRWRNNFFEQELLAWVDHQKYWLDNYPPDAFHLISMEQLTSPDRGPHALYKLGQFLANGEPDIAESLVPAERITCIWDMFVNSKVPGEAERRHSHRSGGPATYPFTSDQLDRMIVTLEKLKAEYRDSSDLVMILDEYVLAIQTTKTGIDQL